MLVARAVSVHELAGDVFGDAEDVIALVFSFERGAANVVNRFALLVHHVVVFEQVFAGVEVLRFDGFLRVFDATGNETGLDGHAFGHAKTVHESFDAFAAEDAHEVVFERKEKARGAGVALAAGASAKLVVDAASLVAFGAEDVQAAERDDFIVFGFALAGEVFVDGFPLVLRDLKDFAFVLEEDHRNAGNGRSSGIGVFRFGTDDGGGLGVGHREAIFEEVLARHEFGIAAEENVGTAASHVGGNSDGSFAAGLSDDAGFAFVLFGVQNFVRNAGFFENVGDGFG